MAQGFAPLRLGLRGKTERAVIDQAIEIVGARPALYWNSEEVENWPGAPAVWVAWS